MTWDEINIGDEVICSQLLPIDPQHTKFFPSSIMYLRCIGHIGKVSSVFPIDGIVHISHYEWSPEVTLEYITPYYIEELALYDNQQSKLRKAINKLK